MHVCCVGKVIAEGKWNEALVICLAKICKLGREPCSGIDARARLNGSRGGRSDELLKSPARLDDEPSEDHECISFAQRIKASIRGQAVKLMTQNQSCDLLPFSCCFQSVVYDGSSAF
jgi:hypothetical protein